jgi:outer membrane protein TolC
MLRSTLLILSLSISSSALCQDARTLTLEEAVAMAARDNPSVQKASLEIGKSADRLAAARTLRMPTFEFNLLESQTITALDFRFPKGVFGSYPATGPIPAENTTVSTPLRPTTYFYARAAQPITQLHRINLGLQLEEARGEAAREKLRAERQSVTKEVKRIYYELVSLQSALQAAQENIKLYRELDRVVGQYVVEKVALKSEGLEVKTQLAAEELTALTLGNALASQKEQLNAMLGRDIQTEFNVSPVADGAIFEVDLATARARAIETRPELKEARLLIKQAEFDQRIKRSQFIPDVSLAFTYLRIAPVSVIPQNIASVGVSLTWEPFDWGRKRRELAEKDKTVEQARIAARAAETQVTVEINSLHRKLRETRASLRVSQLAQETAREKMRVATHRYSEQAALLKDVLQAQSAMAEASNKYQQALLAFSKARADFERAIGEE